jgi:hypothetical protein
VVDASFNATVLSCSPTHGERHSNRNAAVIYNCDASLTYRGSVCCTAPVMPPCCCVFHQCTAAA